MRRVLVVGSGGAGKSTFARRLARRTGLPLIHLDVLYWRPGWAKPSKEEWEEAVAELLRDERWILDGNYAGTFEARLAACDTVIFLDLPRWTCLWRVLRRRVRLSGRVRPDMASGCRERLTWEFIRWIWRYPAHQRPRVLARLAALRADQQAVVLGSAPEMERYLEALGA